MVSWTSAPNTRPPLATRRVQCIHPQMGTCETSPMARPLSTLPRQKLLLSLFPATPIRICMGMLLRSPLPLPLIQVLCYCIFRGNNNACLYLSSRREEHHSRPDMEILARQLGMNLMIGEANNVNQDHVVWLSRLPVLRANNHRQPVCAKTLLEIEVLWEETPLALFATHLKAGQDYEPEQRR